MLFERGLGIRLSVRQALLEPVVIAFFMRLIVFRLSVFTERVRFLLDLRNRVLSPLFQI